MNDLISREAVIDLCSEIQGIASTRGEMEGIGKLWKGVKGLPIAFDLEKVLQDLEKHAEECLHNGDLLGGSKIHYCINIVKEGHNK